MTSEAIMIFHNARDIFKILQYKTNILAGLIFITFSSIVNYIITIENASLCIIL